jgi:hypothetical protein
MTCPGGLRLLHEGDWGGRSGSVFGTVSRLLPHLTTGLTQLLLYALGLPRLAVHDQIRDLHHATPKLNPFNRFQIMTTSTSSSQPTTSSTTIYALLRSGREGDHRAEGDDAAEVRTRKSVSLCLCSVTS